MDRRPWQTELPSQTYLSLKLIICCSCFLPCIFSVAPSTGCPVAALGYKDVLKIKTRPHGHFFQEQEGTRPPSVDMQIPLERRIKAQVGCQKTLALEDALPDFSSTALTLPGTIYARWQSGKVLCTYSKEFNKYKPLFSVTIQVNKFSKFHVDACS